MAVTTFKTKLLKKEKVAEDAWRFYFEKPSTFEYSAGQYIKLFLDIKNPDSRGKTRYFTLSSSPTEKDLQVTTRILKSSFKLKLDSLKIGSTVKIRGPWGDFILDPKEKKPLVFIAGGIGMTPYRSILKYANDSKIKLDLHLFVSYRIQEDILFKEELEDYARFNKKFKFTTTLTEESSQGWKGETGRIDAEMLKRHLENLGDYKYYISGPAPLVFAIQKMLIKANIKEDQIKIDDFSGYDSNF